MDDHQNRVGKASRRDVLKAGAALAGVSGFGASGFASVLSSRPARAAGGIKVKVINASGDFSRVELVLLKELRLFEKYGVDAQQISVADTNKILAGLIGGDGDICPAAGFSGLFPAIEKGAAVKILAGSSLAPLIIMYSNKPDIKSVKDLPGHTVGTGAIGSLLQELVVGVMEKYGVDYKTVRFVDIGSSNDVFKALVGGSIDAGVAPIEFRNSAAQYGLHPLVDGEFWKELPLYTDQAMYASDRAIADNREGLVRVMAAYDDMFHWIQKPQNRPAFLKYYAQAISNSSTADAAFFYDFVSKPGRLASGLVLSPQQLEFVQKLNVELGIQQAVLPFNRCADMSLARDALKLVPVATF